jgi:hypothetical protein
MLSEIAGYAIGYADRGANPYYTQQLDTGVALQQWAMGTFH